MFVSFREGDKFCFYRRTIAWTYRLYLSIVKRGVCQSAFQDLMDFFIRIHRPTRQLLQCPTFIHITELIRSVFAWLNLQILEMNRTFINTNGGSCLHASRNNPMTGDAFCEMWHCGLCDTSSGNHLSSDMHQAIQESASCHNHTFCIDLCAPDGLYADSTDASLAGNRLYQQLISLILPDIQILCFIEMPAPLPDELSSVALGSRTPHGRTLAHVQHAELYRGSIRHQSHLTSKCIDFTYDLSLGDTSDSRIA